MKKLKSRHFDKLKCRHFDKIKKRIILKSGDEQSRIIKKIVDILRGHRSNLPTHGHTMAECTNTEGSFECNCMAGFLGDGVNNCDANICSLCDSSATCTSSACQCPGGYSGTGVSCVSAAKIVVPIEYTPLISVHTGACKDPYLHKISELGANYVAVILNFQDKTWLTCINHARNHGIDIYGIGVIGVISFT